MSEFGDDHDATPATGSISAAAELESLRASEARIRALFEHAPDAVMVVGSDGRIKTANRNACHLLRYGLDELLTLRVADFSMNYDQPAVEDVGTELRESREATVFDEVRRSDGTTFPAEIRLSAVDFGGQTDFIAVIQSRVGEARYRALFDQVPVGLWEEDFSEVKRLLASAGAPPPPAFREFLLANLDLVRQCARAVRVLRVNQTAASMCGASDPSELLGALDRVFTSESIPQFLEAVNALMEGRVNFRMEGINRTLQGEVLWIDLRCRVAPGHEQDWSKVMVSTVDMTERRRVEQEREALEERLRHAEKMQAIGTLAGGVAHDFNNILAVIVGYSELALLKLSAGQSARDDVSQIMQAAFRARDLVHQILAFSRHSAPGQRRFEVRPLVRETMNLLRAAIPANIEVRESIEPNAGTVLADPTQLHQVLMNLCTNARWAMRDQASGVLEVKLDRLKLTEPTSELAAGDYVRLTVSDDGCGMDAKTRERIFEPYFTTRPMAEGSGLGLAVVHGIVSGLGGTVLVRSVVGAGSTFEVFLPRSATPTAAKPPPVRESPKGTERVLFVDDEPALAEVCERMLASLGYRVTATTSARDALELFRKDPNGYDLVITDQSMPRMTGIALTEGILSIRADARVVICTGYSDVLDESRALEVGARMLLMKPLDFATLASSVRRALDAD